ncbi:MAG: carboxypeptidase-like regulatory domain-containing protein [Planctomycetes bacterium]|jgi:protocatechuate 3,4-dioxygenase beta subunit|nr:carboxypeptidase-like regulatory domain-containing protein [Planctomycetota bacterium]
MRRGLPILLMLAGVGALAFVLLKTFSAPAPGPAIPPVAPETEGHEPGPAPAPPPTADPAVVRDPAAPATGAIAGTVREKDSGAPVAGATVVITGTLADGKKSANLVTGEDGGYRFEGLPPGKFTVAAWPVRHADSAVLPVTVAENVEVRLDLEVLPGAVVSGLVTEKGSGAALTGVTVTPNLRHRRTATTGPDGRYRLEGLPAGTLYLMAEGPDHPVTSGMVTVAGPGAAATLDFELARGAVVHGIVLDTRGAPIPGAAVQSVGGGGRQVKSGPDGAFTLRAVPVDRQVVLNATKDGYATALSDPLVLRPAEEMVGLRLTMSAGARVRGLVLDAEGRPAAGAQVMLMLKPGPGFRPSYPPNGKADDRGAFDLFPVPPGEWQVAARLSGAQFVSKDIGTVSEGEVVEGVEIRLPGGERIEGVVSDGEGRPVSGANLNARPADPATPGGFANARTDGAGKFRLEGLPTGNYIVSVHSARGMQVLILEAAAGTRDLKIVVPSPGSISGRVLLAGGEPAGEFFVRVELDDPERPGVVMQERITGEGGRFRLAGVHPGVYAVTASADGGFSERERGIVVAAGQETSGVALVLRPGGTILGRVLGADGSPVAGVRVMAQPVRAALMSPTGSPMQNTGPDGEFALTGLGPGTWRVMAMVGTMWLNSDDVELVSGGEARADLRAPRTGTVVVRVRDEEGRPVAGAWVAVSNEKGRSMGMPEVRIPPDVPPEKRAAAEREARERAFRTDASGRCEREGVTEGHLRILVQAPGFAQGVTTAHLTEAGRVEVEVTLGAAAPGDEETKPTDRSGG